VLSIIAPLYNEEESVPPLAAAVRNAMHGWREDWELLLVDDGSSDGTVEAVLAAAREEPRVRLVSLARNFGQSAAMQAGFDHAHGEVVVTMDGDLQNDPADIPMLVRTLDEGYDLVAGYRENRQDLMVSRKIPSRIANMLLRRVTGVAIRDTGCSLKAYRREVLDRLRLYSDLHRFIPVLAVTVAGARLTERSVRHHPRRFGTSKYGISRVFKVLGDLFLLLLLRRHRERPLAFFAGAAFISFGIASLLGTGAALGGIDFWKDVEVVILASAAVCWASLAGFLLMLGLVAEEIVHTNLENAPLEGNLLRPVA
jgi:glycosyltransferase involved in cell wall biosynthesis